MAPIKSSGSSEIYRLRWQSSNDVIDLSKEFQNFRQNEELFDVKLGCATSDGGAVTTKAHKLVLSAYSPVFKDMFGRLKDNIDPYIFLKGVSQENLSGILDFMYQGSVDISKPELKSFLADAEELQIKGLKFNNVMNNNTEQINIQPEMAQDPLPALKSSTKKSNKRIKKEPDTSMIGSFSSFADDPIGSDDDLQSDVRGSLKRAKRPSKKRKLEEENFDQSLDNKSEYYQMNFPSTTPSEEDDQHGFMEASTPKGNTSQLDIFENIEDKIFGNRKRAMSRCKLCSKEVRRDKCKKHSCARSSLSTNMEHEPMMGHTTL